MTVAIPVWILFLSIIVVSTIIVFLIFKIYKHGKSENRSLWRSMFTEGTGEVSIGSICVFMIIVSYTICMLYATYSNSSLPASPTEIATMSGSIYALKKIQATWEGVTKLKNVITGDDKKEGV